MSRPRTYPEALASGVAEIFHDLASSARGCPELPRKLPSALELFQQKQTAPEVAELFEFAELDSPYAYLRGGESLRIPPEWKARSVPKESPKGLNQVSITPKVPDTILWQDRAILKVGFGSRTHN